MKRQLNIGDKIQFHHGRKQSLLGNSTNYNEYEGTIVQMQYQGHVVSTLEIDSDVPDSDVEVYVTDVTNPDGETIPDKGMYGPQILWN
jgi:hypothetical protein